MIISGPTSETFENVCLTVSLLHPISTHEKIETAIPKQKKRQEILGRVGFSGTFPEKRLTLNQQVGQKPMNNSRGHEQTACKYDLNKCFSWNFLIFSENVKNNPGRRK